MNDALTLYIQGEQDCVVPVLLHYQSAPLPSGTAAYPVAPDKREESSYNQPNRLRVVSNEGWRVSSREPIFARPRVYMYFAGIAKIRYYSQSNLMFPGIRKLLKAFTLRKR